MNFIERLKASGSNVATNAPQHGIQPSLRLGIALDLLIPAIGANRSIKELSSVAVLRCSINRQRTRTEQRELQWIGAKTGEMAHFETGVY